MMSIREFAKRIGVTEGAVRAAIRTNRISRGALGSVVMKNGKRRPAVADPERAAREWRQNTQGHIPFVLPDDLVSARRVRDHAIAMKALAHMFDSMSRGLLREKQLISRSSVKGTLAIV